MSASASCSHGWPSAPKWRRDKGRGMSGATLRKAHTWLDQVLSNPAVPELATAVAMLIADTADRFGCAPLEMDTPGVFGNKAKTKLMQFFSDFAEFANVVNWWLAAEYNHRPWRLQELPKIDLSLHGDFSHGPRYGRSYAIFHNQERLGTLEISPGSQYSTENPQVITHVELEFVRILSFDTIRTFLTDLALHTCDFHPNNKEYLEAQQVIDRAMTEVLWQISRVSRFGLDFEEDHGEINLRLDGTATWYVDRRDCEAFRNGTWKTEVRA